MSQQSWNPIWDEVFAAREWGKYPSENLIQFVARNFYKLDRPRVRILEVGCGTGANIWYIAREGFAAYGIDGSHVALNIARARMEKEGLQALFELGDISQLPYEDACFDAVIDIECLYANKLESAKEILGEITRVLKPSGKFFSRTFSDKMSVGPGDQPSAALEYPFITMGPLKGTGFARLSNENTIRDLYGAYFNIDQIDTLDYTLNNQAMRMYEYLIIATKKD